MPFNSEVIIKEVLGKDILDALEYGTKNLPGKTSRFSQVSGISFKVDTSIKSSVVVDNEEMFVKVDGKRRVYDVKVGNKPLDVNKNIKYLFLIILLMEEMVIQCLINMKKYLPHC